MTLNDGATVGYCQLSWLFVCRCYQYLVNKDVYYCWLKHHCRSRMQKPIQLRKLLIAQPVSRWATVTAPRSVPGRLPAYELCLRRRSYIQSTTDDGHPSHYSPRSTYDNSNQLDRRCTLAATFLPDHHSSIRISILVFVILEIAHILFAWRHRVTSHHHGGQTGSRMDRKCRHKMADISGVYCVANEDLSGIFRCTSATPVSEPIVVAPVYDVTATRWASTD